MSVFLPISSFLPGRGPFPLDPITAPRRTREVDAPRSSRRSRPPYARCRFDFVAARYFPARVHSGRRRPPCPRSALNRPSNSLFAITAVATTASAAPRRKLPNPGGKARPPRLPFLSKWLGQDPLSPLFLSFFASRTCAPFAPPLGRLRHGKRARRPRILSALMLPLPTSFARCL